MQSEVQYKRLKEIQNEVQCKREKEMQSEIQYKREKEVKRGPHMCQWMERVKRMIQDSEETD